MNSSLFIILGVVFIFVALIFLSKQGKAEKDIYNDILVKHKDIKDYTGTMEQIINNMDALIDNVLEKYNVLEEKIEKEKERLRKERNKYSSINQQKDKQAIKQEEKIEKEYKESEHPNEKQNFDKKKTLREEVTELKKAGLTNQQIAKRLGKSIREIDIITKMFNIKNSNNFS